MSRDPIPLATCHRLMAESCDITGGRISEQAVAEAQKAVTAYIKKAGENAEKLLRLKKAKTVNFEIAQMVLVNKCAGVGEEDLASAPRKGKGQRGLPLAGVDRVFRNKLSGDRISEDVKRALVGAAEAYLRSLGARAGLMAKAGKRVTIQGADVISARKTLV